MTKTPSGRRQREKLVLGLSNLSSAVAAVLLQQQGYQIQAVYLDWAPKTPRPGTELGCLKKATPERKLWVQKTGKQLGIPVTVVPAFDVYEEEVLDRLTHDLLQTKFRNPCIACHSTLKLGLLNAEREKCGAQWMATGHFVQVRHEADGTPHLYRGSDPGLDQSDLLSRTDPRLLSHLITPLGGLSFANIQKVAVEFELREASIVKKKSVRSCVWQDPHLGEVLEARAADSLISRGTVQSLAGEVLGDHQGLHLHRLSQPAEELHLIDRRLGMGLSVVGYEPARKAIIVGHDAHLLTSDVMLEQLSWMRPIQKLKRFKCFAKFSGVVTTAEPIEVALQFYDRGRAHMHFVAPFPGIHPGQSVVLYEGEEVLGEGSVARLGAPERV